MGGKRRLAQPIAAVHLPEYIGRLIWIDYGGEMERRWLRCIEPVRNDSVAVIARGTGPWMSEYGWGWQAWEKKPTEEERAAHPLGAKRGLQCPGVPEWRQNGTY